jgi:putative membrane protein insertion efficiency factor
MNIAQFTLIGAVRIYRGIVSPVLTAVFTPLGFGCRFHPTCSQYAAEAIRTHGACRGSWLAARRLCRCHPWGGSGCDPVPASPGAGQDAGPPQSH